MYRIRQLGYGLECGVIELTAPNRSVENIAIFSNCGITSHIFVSDTHAILLSEKGEMVRFNCETESAETRIKLFNHSIRLVRLFHDTARQSVIVLTGDGIFIVDRDSLDLKRHFNAGQRSMPEEYTLFNFADVKDKFQALAAKERDARKKLIEDAKARGETPELPDMKWNRMAKPGLWPRNSGEYCTLNFNTDHAVLRDNGEIVCAYKTYIGVEDKKETSGIATINLDKPEVIFRHFASKLSVRAMSHNGRLVITDYIGFQLPKTDQTNIGAPRKKGLFGLVSTKVKTDETYKFPLELWNIENELTSIKLLSTGQFEYFDLLTPHRGDWILPNDWYDDSARRKLNESLLSAAENQFWDITHKLIWSEEKFALDIEREMRKRRINLNDLVNKGRTKGTALRFSSVLNNRLCFAYLVGFIRNELPDFFEHWASKTLSEDQNRMLMLIRAELSRQQHHNLAVCFGAENDHIYTFLRTGYLATTEIENETVTRADVRPIPKPDGPNGWKEAARYITLSPSGETALRFEYWRACVDFALDNSQLTETAAKVIYDKDQFVAENEIAIKLARKIRFGFVSIRSKSVENIIKGLDKLAPEFLSKHEDIIIGNRWDAGLYHSGNLVLEHELMEELIKQDAQSAIPALENFLESIMKVQKAYNDPKSEWGLWHNDDGALVGAPTMAALIRLKRSVSPQCLRFVRQRDFEHDVYMDERVLPKTLLPHLNLQTPGLLNLILIVALQLLATGRVGHDIFVAHGMDVIKLGLKTGKLSSELVAKTMIAEVKALGNLSWASKNGPHGLIAQAVYGLDRSQPWQGDIADMLLRHYPKAKSFLDKIS